MTITIQGNWTVKVKSKSAAYKQRFVIKGSDNADGTYEGNVNTPGVNVIGAQWTISVEHKPTGSAQWIPSDERLTTPTRSGGQIVFDVLSNDTGPDKDYNDLVLTCSMPATDSDFVIYGKVRTYSGWCKFNPCFPNYVVIDTPRQLKDLLKYKSVRAIVEELYPERMKLYEKIPPIKGPWPEPDPVPFRPMMIPMKAVSNEELGNVKRIVSMETKAMPTSLTRGVNKMAAVGDLEASATMKISSSHIRDLAKIKDRIKPFCKVKDQPGLLLRFLEYDRTAEELVGCPYSGEGDRQVLGLTVSDEQGNYIFCFTRTLEDIAAEFGDVVEGGPSLATQLRPDIIVQVVSGMGPESGVLFETALYSNIPNLKRINLCIPEDSLNPGPSACQGGRAIQAIGNIWTIPGVGNTFDADGCITATNQNGPEITRGAWVGRLDLFACFTDHPDVKYYTIRYRRPDGAWQFVQEIYRHPKISDIGTPGYMGTQVGPFFDRPGNLDNIPAYDNIEVDPAWVITHRIRKIQLTSSLYENSLYEPNENPRTVEFKIEGYNNADNKVFGAEDSIKLYIDNRPIFGDIDSISMGGISPGECALFELPSPNEPLTVKFKVDHLGGFLQGYRLIVLRGSYNTIPVSDTTAPVQPLSLTYDEVTHGNTFFGTFDAVGPDIEGYVVAELQPNSGVWLPTGKDFCAFAFEIHGTPRVTDGYNLGIERRLDVELVGISYTPPPTP